MEVDYGPALPPHLGADPSRHVDDASYQHLVTTEELSRLPLTKALFFRGGCKYLDLDLCLVLWACFFGLLDAGQGSSVWSEYWSEAELGLISCCLWEWEFLLALVKGNLESSLVVTKCWYEASSTVARHRSPKPSRKTHSDQDQLHHDPDPPCYRDVALSDISSRYAEEVDTFRRILKLPDPRESMPRSSTAVMGLDDEKGRQELRPRGTSSMLPLYFIIKDAFDKFNHDIQAANLPEGKYIKAPPSTAKWYKVGQPCYEDKIKVLFSQSNMCLVILLWVYF